MWQAVSTQQLRPVCPAPKLALDRNGTHGPQKNVRAAYQIARRQHQYSALVKSKTQLRSERTVLMSLLSEGGDLLRVVPAHTATDAASQQRA